MKKIFKYSFLTIIIIIVAFGFIFKGRISLYLNIGNKYMQVKDDISTFDSMDNLTNLTTINASEYKDIIYKNTNNTPLSLDVYGPKKQRSKGSPVILYVHGGSWAYGDKSIPAVLSPLLDAFREEGYSIISVSYELMKDSINFEKQASDIKDSIRWINKNKDTYNFNTNEIGVIGVSAGAHLALLASYSDNNQFVDSMDLANYPSNVKYILDFFGPTDLSTLNTSNADYEINQSLSTISNRAEIIEKYSPINYVKENLPKTLIIHSKSDKMVPYENSEALYSKSKSLGNKVDLVTIEDMGHDLSNVTTKDTKKIAYNVLKFIVNNSPL
ncbi:alpha/beta hydrolase fold domain-containing protein [Clostridium paraputrificum]|uniref:alpha/beta hydrolase fold domain-containing protein n=1 Tax=Clostridium TaxID=1485 RepID=UPI003D3489D7